MSGEITESSEEIVIQVSKSVKDDVDAIMDDKSEMMPLAGILPLAIVIILRTLKCKRIWKCIEPIIDGSDDGVLINPKCRKWELTIKCN